MDGEGVAGVSWDVLMCMLARGGEGHRCTTLHLLNQKQTQFRFPINCAPLSTQFLQAGKSNDSSDAEDSEKCFEGKPLGRATAASTQTHIY